MRTKDRAARSAMARVGVAALGSRPVSFAFSRIVPGLRVLAYHAVPDRLAFGAHVDEISRHYRPVSADEVVAAAMRGLRLPRRALWVTFDDGDPTVLGSAAHLAEAGVSATVFVCPGVVDTQKPLWWQTVDEATRRGVVPVNFLSGDPDRFRASLKAVDDAARRKAVKACQEAMEASSPDPFHVRQVTTEDLEAWVSHGHSVGNHTWDHPLLDRCPEPEQERQIAWAHDWLRERLPHQPAVFAYPNGNNTEYAEKVATSLGYKVRALFDHRVALLPRSVRPISRLRIDSDAATARFRAIASGAHPLAFTVRQIV